MTTTADRFREMIQERSARFESLGTRQIHHDSEHVKAVKAEIDICLNAADLCELLCDSKGMKWHLETVKMLLARLETGSPERAIRYN